MPLRIAPNFLELKDEYEISYQRKQETVYISDPNKEEAKELFTFALIEVGLKEAS